MLIMKTDSQIASEKSKIKKAMILYETLATVGLAIGIAGGIWLIILMAHDKSGTYDVYKLGAWMILTAGIFAAGAYTAIAKNLHQLSQKTYQRVTDENRICILESLLKKNHPHLYEDFTMGYQKGYLLETEYEALEQAMFNQPSPEKKPPDWANH